MCIRIALFILIVGAAQKMWAQQVSYSPYFRDYSFSSFQVAGRAGDFYWVLKQRPHRSARVEETSGPDTKQAFELYDSRMRFSQRIAVDPLPRETIKEYIVSGMSGLDQLLLLSAAHATKVVVNRYSADGRFRAAARAVDSFSFPETGSGFLLLRSPNRKRIQLVGFESREARSPLVHVTLFDSDWNILRKTVIDDANISQPCIQDDFISYPIEHFDDFPIKLTDNGEWLMSSTARKNYGLLLFHFCADGQYSFQPLKVAGNFTIEDVAVSVDSKNSGATVGILSGFRHTTLKQFQVTYYSLIEGRFNFDSSYFFNTLTTGNLKDKTLVRERIVGVPGPGYMYFKEYGREKDDEAGADIYNDEEAARLLDSRDVGIRASAFETEGPSLQREGGAQRVAFNEQAFERGDLAMFYFPARDHDSTWKGIIKAPQKSEMNWPSLSYLVLPVAGQMVFVYNSTSGFSDVASSTVVDEAGRSSDGSIVFWKFNRVLNFQQSRRINMNEVAVPYLDRPGFAIIRI